MNSKDFPHRDQPETIADGNFGVLSRMPFSLTSLNSFRYHGGVLGEIRSIDRIQPIFPGLAQDKCEYEVCNNRSNVVWEGESVQPVEIGNN
jgi:hypothetical protein